MTPERYVIWIMKTPQGYVATCPDLPGCRTTGQTYNETLQAIIQLRDQWLHTARQEGHPLPLPTTERKHPPRGILAVRGFKPRR